MMYQAIVEVEQDTKIVIETVVTKQFGEPLSMLSTWLNSAATIKKGHKNSDSAHKRISLCQYSDADETLLLWFKNARALNIPLSGPILQVKAANFSSRFKEGHNESFHVPWQTVPSYKLFLRSICWLQSPNQTLMMDDDDENTDDIAPPSTTTSGALALCVALDNFFQCRVIQMKGFYSSMY